ncbi:hypothetical protein DYB28_007251 [Aphanomyces astaci]|uniref:ERAP1-like C-terminal domain-containing protein n=1 Tax=Aphanomyces astaci TaxID=112090 RepID=A0A9X8DYI8_APHAT|nr:hypothetical protein DYB28_007251 [Aphanomyces astaci]
MGQFTWDASPTDQDLTSNFRRDVIAMLAAANDPAVAAEASARFHAAVSTRYPIISTKAAVWAGRAGPVSICETQGARLGVGRVVGGVHSQDIDSVFGSVAADGSTVAWEYVQAKWDALNAQYSQIVVWRLLWVSIANFQTEQAAAAVEAFLVGRPQEGAFARPLASFLENIGTGTAMYARDMTPLAAWTQTL